MEFDDNVLLIVMEIAGKARNEGLKQGLSRNSLGVVLELSRCHLGVNSKLP